eukprot:CAMPEP_0174990348 /NCGR_PEP_ID=MMETSP0004_2-20121128/21268_1 /TAXON_ID=420556 /ORGANISM="Ochromonas sp., Strain CCMP1393" /LENGTH=510 /DNA_ID=CAMNT_0016243939 /DNA_START=163 /DNA_END=1692 /DNA_ORIENTATION=-
MFIDDNAFEDEFDHGNNNSKYRATENLPPNKNAGFDGDEEADGLPAFRGGAGGNSAANSRARMLAQQRELQLKKRQSNVLSGGMVRSSIDSSNGGGSPFRQSGDSQFTPAVRQFSAPKASAKDPSNDASPEKDSEFTRNSRRSANSRYKDRYDDDDDDGEDQRRMANANRRAEQRQSRDHSSSSNNGNRRGEEEGRGSRYRGGARNGRDRHSGGAHGHSRYQDDDDDYDDYGDDDYNNNSNNYGRGRGGNRRGNNNNNYDDEEDNNYGRNGGGGGSKWTGALGADQHSDSAVRAVAVATPMVAEPASPGPNNANSSLSMQKKTAPSAPAASATPLMTSPDLSDMRKFLLTPLPRSCGVVQCYIRRNKSGTNKLFPVYSLYLKEGDVFLMASKKRPKNKTSNYLISMDQNDLNRAGKNYLGKLRSNFVGTEFQIFDDGVNPKDSEPDEIASGAGVRCEMGSVMYAANVLGSRGPRKMQVALPGLDEQQQIMKWRDTGSAADHHEGGGGGGG